MIFNSLIALLLLLPQSAAFVPNSIGRAFLSQTTTITTSSSLAMSDDERYTIADQPARFARAQRENNQRYLDITTVYDPSLLQGKRVAVTGANRGIGLSLATELAAAGAKVIGIVRSSSPELDALNPEEVITGIDVTDDAKCVALSSQIKGGPIDIVSIVCREQDSLPFLFS